jgi:TonB family protein
MERNNLSGVAVSIAALVLILGGSSSLLSQTGNGALIPDSGPGQKLYREGKYPEAVSSLKKSVKVNPQDADAWYYLGLSSLKVNDFKNATKAFENACKLKPNSAPAHSGLAYSLLLRNKLKDGFRESERAVSLDANNAEARFVLGFSYLQVGAREKALNEADTAIELKPNFADAHLLRSQALVQFTGVAIVQPPEPPAERTNRYNEAISALETYLRLAQPSPETPLWREQLEALKFHVGMSSKAAREQNKIYSARDVTTKARILAKPEPQYTNAARSNEVRGTVVLRALLAADGTVKHIVVIYGLPHGLTRQSVQAAQKMKFVPATVNAQPVGMFVQLEYNFNIF